MTGANNEKGSTKPPCSSLVHLVGFSDLDILCTFKASSQKRLPSKL